ncbi:SAM-dependent methyltransferase [Kitasatospora sp. MAP12-15]|uniref:class I SAM-dependent methyltransferase n=1 Tax=unclassified Kitasatospora TaxID=2633591 RepID=UPI002472F89F|nr:methyltransferase domain-containing protein [Kitasatospora sp. MAP12-44]MDH6114915.1 SAM-dependent methyltransferase [Kitasatospora sp. MAP12-44]
MSATSYAFDNQAPDAEVQLAILEAFLDPVTSRRLDRLGLRPGARCWEVGAGGGSIARLLADRVGPHGQVIATDLDLARFHGEAPNLELRRHDARHEAPPGEGFDLIHARLVLLHLPERREVLATLAGALRPGGVLLVEEFDRSPLHVLLSPGPEAAALFTRVVDRILEVLATQGADLHWAQQAHGAMADLGLTEVLSTVHAESWSGDGGARLHEINSRQLHDRLLATGLTPDELSRFRTLVRDPAFSALSYSLVSISARKPA